MNYFVSTRNINEIKTSKQAIIKGISNDGGLYTPLKINKIELNKLINLSYKDIAYQILANLFDDYSSQELKKCIENAYTNSFTSSEVTLTTKLGNYYMAELYHGKTSAFKDVALSILPHLLKTALNNKKVYILTATSGDTGKAALEAFKNIENVYITVFYPKNGVSTIQEKQMITSSGTNVEVIALNGNFDDCQNLVKEAYEKIQTEDIFLSSANSINIGRLAPQIVYYFKTYIDLLKNGELERNEKVNFVVPSGNFGNILAGYIAKKMGCPINKLICASNSNNVLTDFINTGTYDRNRPFYNTISPSMDILISSNLERLLFMLEKDDKKIIQYMNDLKTKGKYTVSNDLLNTIKENFSAYYYDDIHTKKAINDAYILHKKILDPHTAIAYAAAKEYKDNHKNIILATASPYKFAKNVLEAINNQKLDDIEAIFKLKELTDEKIPDNLVEVLHLPVIHNKVLHKKEALAYIESRVKNLCIK